MGIERLGVLGGTFDPVHVAHLVVAGDTRSALGLDRVLLVVAGWDQPALLTLYDRYGGIAYGLAYRLLQEPGAAEEVEVNVALAPRARRPGGGCPG